jgi:putative transposase
MSGGIYNKQTGYHNRRSIRLKGYDYSRPGAYFVTICIHDRAQRLFGNVVDGKMALNDAGECAQRCWLSIPAHFPDVTLDEFVVMPNHVHGIIVILDGTGKNDTAEPAIPVGVQDFEPLRNFETLRNFEPLRKQPGPMAVRINQYQHIIPRSIGSIVRGYKIGVSKWFRERTQDTNVWQRNYYDHVIRDDNSFYFIRKYIRDNPVQWNSDFENHLNNEIIQFYNENQTVDE